MTMTIPMTTIAFDLYAVDPKNPERDLLYDTLKATTATELLLCISAIEYWTHANDIKPKAITMYVPLRDDCEATISLATFYELRSIFTAIAALPNGDKK